MFLVLNFIKLNKVLTDFERISTWKVNYLITEEVLKIKKKKICLIHCRKIFKRNVYFGPKIFCENS